MFCDKFRGEQASGSLTRAVAEVEVGNAGGRIVAGGRSEAAAAEVSGIDGGREEVSVLASNSSCIAAPASTAAAAKGEAATDAVNVFFEAIKRE